LTTCVIEIIHACRIALIGTKSRTIRAGERGVRPDRSAGAVGRRINAGSVIGRQPYAAY
jgi:hypothetical protein